MPPRNTSEGPNPSGLCQCGCGGKTALAKRSHSNVGWVKGKPRRFILGHSLRGPTFNIKENSRAVQHGYREVHLPSHPNANVRGNILLHVLIATTALGKPIPAEAQVHHADGIASNNQPNNLVICQDQKYHRLLHRRMRALAACGNPSWRMCRYCKQWDDPENFGGREVEKRYHKSCAAKYRRENKKANQAA